MDELLLLDCGSLVCVLLLPPATAGVLKIWFQGSIFARWRSRLEASDSTFAALMMCPLCLSMHVAFWLYVCGVMLPRILGVWGLFTLGGVIPVFTAVFVGHMLYDHQSRLVAQPPEPTPEASDAREEV